jgi:DNA (cytosine-5)-methyltransferase 1
LLNAADFGAATKRIRLFVIAVREDVYRRGLKDIPWPNPTHSEEQWQPVWRIIDWSRPRSSIFGRKRTLKDNTLRRIEIGLKKFADQTADPFVVVLRNHQDASPICGPLSTICTSGAHHALAIPFQFKAIGRKPGVSKSITDPLPTIVAARENHAIVVPFSAMLCQSGSKGCRVNSVNEPMGTITTAKGGERALCLPFLTKYYGTGSVRAVTEPLDTITTKDRFGLAMVSLVQTMQRLGVADIGYRMFSDTELALAQGFPAGYYLHGNKADRVKQVGNSVSPPVARAICETLMEAA